jgi:hypothetical protein
MICIGYAGVEAFDIILYIGKALTMLNYPVLIIDLSDTGALTKTIYHGMNLDSTNDIIHYRNLNYIRKVPEKKDLNDFSNGVVFVVYGFNHIKNHPIHLDFLNIVLDTFPNNIDKVNKFLRTISTDNMQISILVRDVITLDDFERTKASIKSGQSPASTRYLYYDIYDHENALQCQTSQLIRFRRISSGMKKLIMSEISDMLPSIKPSIVRKAISLARKGEKLR